MLSTPWRRPRSALRGLLPWPCRLRWAGADAGPLEDWVPVPIVCDLRHRAAWASHVEVVQFRLDRGLDHLLRICSLGGVDGELGCCGNEALT